MIVAPWQSPRSAWSEVIVPPTEEPFTLAEGKLRAALDWPTTDPEDPRDQLMRDHISAARAQVERDTGLALLTQTREVYFSTLPDGRIALPMHALPLQEVITVTPDDPAVIARAPLIPFAPSFRNAGLLASALDGVSAGIARIKVGWIDAKDLREKAPLLLQAVGLLTAHFATTGRDAVVTGTIATTIPLGYEEAIASYRLVWVI